MNPKRLMIFVALVPAVVVLTSPLPAGPLDDQYNKLLETEKNLTTTKAALQDQKIQLEQQRKGLIQQRKANAGLKKQTNQPAPTIDYSLYDRCPNGKSWDECDHVREKAAWLRDQQDKTKVFQERMAKIQRDFAANEKAINDSLSNYFSSLKGYDQKKADLKEAAQQLKTGISDLPLYSKTFDQKAKDKFTQVNMNVDDYKAVGDTTNCNKYLADYAKNVLKGPLPPQLVDKSGATRLANDMYDQLSTAARTNGSGWKSLSLESNLNNPASVFREAQELANQGKFVIIAYKTGDQGHVAVVVPNEKMYRSGASWDQIGVPYVTQAGSAKSKFGGKSVFDAKNPIPFNEAFPAKDDLDGKIDIFVAP
jgi:hypothetical protein